jgi:lysozyme
MCGLNSSGETMSVNQLSCSPRGRALIEKFEGLRLTAYQDMVGVWTIGYGHTGPDVKAGLTITQQQAEQLLINDLARFNNGVNALVTVKINQNQFDALISFSYNLGLGSLQQSTLLRLLNAGNFQAAADQFPRWDRAGGKEVAGLLARRNAERALFLTPD